VVAIVLKLPLRRRFWIWTLRPSRAGRTTPKTRTRLPASGVASLTLSVTVRSGIGAGSPTVGGGLPPGGLPPGGLGAGAGGPGGGGATTRTMPDIPTPFGPPCASQ
jgi:hypothetical protein